MEKHRRIFEEDFDINAPRQYSLRFQPQEHNAFPQRNSITHSYNTFPVVETTGYIEKIYAKKTQPAVSTAGTQSISVMIICFKKLNGLV
jgi:hypothetical protein